jgi:hypothetical protein
MLNAAYAEYRKAKATGQIGTATTIYQHSAER